jgi:hypothetical protein
MESKDELVDAIRDLIAINKKVAHGVPLWRAFLVGAIGAIGASIGAALVIALLSSLLGWLSVYDFFKPVVNPVLPYVQSQAKTKPQIDDLPSPVYSSPSPEPSPSPSPTSVLEGE